MNEKMESVTIKEEEVNIDCDFDDAINTPEEQSDGNGIDAAFGPILLKYEVLPFNRDDHPKEKCIETEPSESLNTVAPATTVVEDPPQMLGKNEDASIPETSSSSTILERESGQPRKKAKTAPTALARELRARLQVVEEGLVQQQELHLLKMEFQRSETRRRKLEGDLVTENIRRAAAERKLAEARIQQFEEARSAGKKE